MYRSKIENDIVCTKLRDIRDKMKYNPPEDLVSNIWCGSSDEYNVLVKKSENIVEFCMLFDAVSYRSRIIEGLRQYKEYNKLVIESNTELSQIDIQSAMRSRHRFLRHRYYVSMLKSLSVPFSVVSEPCCVLNINSHVATYSVKFGFSCILECVDAINFLRGSYLEHDDVYVRLTEIRGRLSKFDMQEVNDSFNMSSIVRCNSLNQYKSRCLRADDVSVFCKLYGINNDSFDWFAMIKNFYESYNNTVSSVNLDLMNIGVVETPKFDTKIICDVYKYIIEDLETPVPYVSIPCINLKLIYDSPAGNSHYEQDFSMSLSDIVDFLRFASCKQTKVSDERAKMTPSLRYEILKRDNFHCVLCGRGIEDGVKLEVDHIIPVSKGGKTEPSNLRTLCRDCNRGKSDKLED